MWMGSLCWHYRQFNMQTLDAQLTGVLQSEQVLPLGRSGSCLRWQISGVTKRHQIINNLLWLYFDCKGWRKLVVELAASGVGSFASWLLEWRAAICYSASGTLSWAFLTAVFLSRLFPSKSIAVHAITWLHSYMHMYLWLGKTNENTTKY